MNTSSDPKVQEYRRRICTAMNFISHNLQTELTLDEIAQVAHFSKFHFHRLFNSMVGETVGEFNKRLRVEGAARTLIHDPSIDITRLSQNFCFSSSQNFARSFKQHFGVTPSGFKKENSNQRHIISNTGHSLQNPTLYDENTVNWQDSSPNTQHEYDVSIEQIDKIEVAYTRRLGAYGFEGCSQAYNKLIPWAISRGLIMDEKIIGVIWDNSNVTAEENCRYDACITIPTGFVNSGDMALQTLAQGTYAVFKTAIINNDFDTPWKNIMGDWLPKSGYVPDDLPCYEIVMQSGHDNPQGKWLIAMHVPIKSL